MFEIYMLLQEMFLPPILFNIHFYITKGIPKLRLLGNISSRLKEQQLKIFTILKNRGLLRFNQVVIEFEKLSNITYSNPIYIDNIINILTNILSDKKLLKKHINKPYFTLYYNEFINNLNYLYITNYKKINDIVYKSNVKIFYQGQGKKQIHTKQFSLLQLNKLKLLEFIILLTKNGHELYIQNSKVPKNIYQCVLKKYILFLQKHNISNSHISKIIDVYIHATHDFYMHQKQLTSYITDNIKIPMQELSTLITMSYPLIISINLHEYSPNQFKIFSKQNNLINKIILFTMLPCRCGNFMSSETRCTCSASSLQNYLSSQILPILKLTNNAIIYHNSCKKELPFKTLYKRYSQLR